MSKLPLVAVAAACLHAGRVSGWADRSEAVQAQYLDGLRRAGALPVALGPPAMAEPLDGARLTVSASLVELVARFAGLVLIGGPDVDPEWYGEAAGPEVYGIDRGRDAFEMGLSRAALAAGVPLLGVCRGIQVLDVALGGSLWQHLGELDLPVPHGVPVASGIPAAHDVDVAPGSRLSRLVQGAKRIEACVSVHHQGVHQIAPGLVATGWSPDGLVEALETPADGPWCVAVQWHPERSAALDPVQQGIFDGFVEAAGR